MTAKISIKIAFLVLVILAAISEAMGDIILKKRAIEGKNFFFIFGLIVYFLATMLRAFSLKYEFLSKAISIVTIINLIIVILVGVIYFKEDLSSTNKLGIALGIISIVLMEI